MGCKVVLLSARKGHASFSIKVARIAVNSLIELVAKSRNDRAEADEIIETLSDELVLKVHLIHMKDLGNIPREVIDTYVAKFDQALHRGHKIKAENFASTAMIILSSCVKQGNVSEFPLSYFAEQFVQILHNSKKRQDRLVTGIINKEIKRLNHLAGRDTDQQAKYLILSILALLRSSWSQNLAESLTAISSATADALCAMAEEGNHRIVDNLLKDLADTIYIASSSSQTNDTKHISLSGAIQALMIAALKRNADVLIETLSASWVATWDRAAETWHTSKSKNSLQKLMAEREDAICLGVENKPHKSPSSWDVSFQLLLTAITRGKDDVRDSLSDSIISGLARARIKVEDGSVRPLVRGSFNKPFTDGDNERAAAVSNTCMQLIRTAIRKREDKLAKDLSAVWVAALDMNNTDNAVMLLLHDVLTRPFTRTIIDGDESKARENGTIGIELILAAIRGQRASSISRLARSWVLSLIDALPRGSSDIVSQLIAARTRQLTEIIMYSDAREAEVHGMAAIELTVAAQDAGRSEVAEDLEASFVEALGKAIEQQAGLKAGEMLYQIRLNHLDKMIRSGTSDDVRKWFGILRDIASHARGRNPAVYKIIQEERNWGLYTSQA
ncbi:hypothetical protein ASPCADRAFT_4224 [Aspergillus carbonarius ITEM 5010]|uniref:Uncharacterized protein n=1 Tax=Aspergillus carbonarius (strain ITEM 5010) TaxID=602072 RepID=A0A1R3RSZ5_ASPC5|nr:hypothetical protein ASPCADRAFT_4224 [Aspergillus carbonarius ITEM 5010]